MQPIYWWALLATTSLAVLATAPFWWRHARKHLHQTVQDVDDAFGEVMTVGGSFERHQILQGAALLLALAILALPLFAFLGLIFGGSMFTITALKEMPMIFGGLLIW